MSVLTGRVKHSEAISALLKLRDVYFDKDGDLNDYNSMYLYCRSKGWKDVDFTWYGVGNG